MSKCFLKYLLLICLAPCFAFGAAAQALDSTAVPIQKNYLKTAKGYRTTGNVLLIGGIAVLGGTLIVATGDAMVTVFTLGIHEPRSYKTPALIGAGCVAASIPLYIVGGAYRRKARALTSSLKVEQAWAATPSAMGSLVYPAVALKVALN